MEKQTQVIMQEPASWIPCSMPDVPDTFLISVSNSFYEISSGHFEATLSIPTSFSSQNSRLFLQLSRVGCKASICVSGPDNTSISCTHYGSFTDWQIELTSLFSNFSGDISSICLHITLNLESDCTTTSPYQKAGILGNIRLVQTPLVCFKDIYVRSQKNAFSNEWQFCILCPLISYTQTFSNSITIEVQTPEGIPVSSLKVLPEHTNQEVTLPVPSQFVRLWNPESAYCFRILCSIQKNDVTIERCERMAGLFQIKKQKQTVFFNDFPLKLRGLAYREPLLGEKQDPISDLELFKKAHINYLRSLFYPFSESFLSLCDQYGILVEQSAPIEEVGQTLPAFQNAPALRPLFLDQFREMVLAGRSHPCVLLWCLGHNCVWGDQFHLGQQLIRSLDQDRLINFHLPMTIPQDDWIPDVWTLDYNAWNLPADVCFDQMVIFHTQGADNPIGYALGKAEDLQIPVLHDAYALVPVYDLDALESEDGIHEFWGNSIKHSWDIIRCTPGALGGAIMSAIDESVSFSPALHNFRYGILDCEHRPKPEYWHVAMSYLEDPLSIDKMPQKWLIHNSRLQAFINPRTGLLTGVFLDEKLIICEGPFLNTGRFFLKPWQLISINNKTIDRGISLTICGQYGTSCFVTFQIIFDEYGTIDTTCCIDSISCPMPHQVKAGIGLDPGGLDEYGICYILPASSDTLSWTRDSLWNCYPSNHIGRPNGIAHKNCLSDFTSRKANLTNACVFSSKMKTALFLHPTVGQSIRLSLSTDPRCILSLQTYTNHLNNAHILFDGPWFKVNDKAGHNYSNEFMAKDRGASCCIRFYGTGLTVYGTTDRIRGLCDVWIDQKLVSHNLSQHTPAVQMPGMSRGYEKRFHQILFHIDTLSYDLHECRITILGEKEEASQETWISIDSVEIVHPDYQPRIAMTVSCNYNYPRLTQGNYMHPAVMMNAGDVLTCRLSAQHADCAPVFYQTLIPQTK